MKTLKTSGRKRHRAISHQQHLHAPADPRLRGVVQCRPPLPVSRLQVRPQAEQQVEEGALALDRTLVAVALGRKILFYRISAIFFGPI